MSNDFGPDSDFEQFTNRFSRAGVHWELLIAKDGTVHIEVVARPPGFPSIVDGTEPGFSAIYTFDPTGSLKGMGIYE